MRLIQLVSESSSVPNPLYGGTTRSVVAVSSCDGILPRIAVNSAARTPYKQLITCIFSAYFVSSEKHYNLGTTVKNSDESRKQRTHFVVHEYRNNLLFWFHCVSDVIIVHLIYV